MLSHAPPRSADGREAWPLLVDLARSLAYAFVILAAVTQSALNALSDAVTGGGQADLSEVLIRWIIEGTVIGGIGGTLVWIGFRLARTYIDANEKLLDRALQMAGIEDEEKRQEIIEETAPELGNGKDNGS